MSDLLSVIVGGALTLVGGFAGRFWDRQQDARALREAMRAEIAGILAIAEARHHETKAVALLAQWKAGEDTKMVYYGSDQAWPDPIYEANLAKIGLAGIYAGEITAFYTRLRAVRITVKAFEDHAIDEQPLAFRIAQLEEALAIWRDAKTIAARLIQRL